MNKPELWFEFQLAAKLRMTVAELRERMDNREFHLWNLFLRLEQAEQNKKEA